MKLVLEFSDAQMARVAAAFGRMDGLHDTLGKDAGDNAGAVVPRPATTAEVTARIVSYVEGVVSGQEHAVAIEAARASVAELGTVTASVQS